MGRSTLLTPEREERILHVLRCGGTWEAAAAAVDMAAATLHEWRRRGAGNDHRELGDPDGIYAAFVEKCTRAIDQGEVDAIEAVRNAFTQGATTKTIKRTKDENGNVTHEEITERTDPPEATMALKWLERRRAKKWSPTSGSQAPRGRADRPADTARGPRDAR